MDWKSHANCTVRAQTRRPLRTRLTGSFQKKPLRLKNTQAKACLFFPCEEEKFFSRGGRNLILLTCGAQVRIPRRYSRSSRAKASCEASCTLWNQAYPKSARTSSPGSIDTPGIDVSTMWGQPSTKTSCHSAFLLHTRSPNSSIVPAKEQPNRKTRAHPRASTTLARAVSERRGAEQKRQALYSQA